MTDAIKLLILIATSPLIFLGFAIFGVAFPIIVVGVILSYIIVDYFKRRSE